MGNHVSSLSLGIVVGRMSDDEGPTSGVANMLSKAMQVLFAVVCLASLPSTAVFTYGMYAEVYERKAKYPEYPVFEDLLPALWYGIGLIAIRWVLTHYVFGPMSLSWLSPHKREPKHVGKFCDSAYQLIYFVGSSAVLLVVLLNPQDALSNILPPSLGGSGEIANCWRGAPYEYFLSPNLKTIYLVELGFHIQSIVWHVAFQDARSDHVEMLSHHIVTIILIVFSFVGNMSRVGIVILLIHDLPDIFVFWAKLGANTPYTKFTLTGFVSMLATWGYMRLYVLPFVVFNSSWFEAAAIAGPFPGMYFLNACLFFLIILHAYWYVLFIDIGLHFLNTGETVDKQSLEPGTELKQSKQSSKQE